MKTPREIVLKIIEGLEQQKRNIDLAKEYKVSVSLVEKINQCKKYVEYHNYKNNIRNENKKQESYRKTVLNEYSFVENIVFLRILNTSNQEVITLIDKEDYEKVSVFRWTISNHDKDKRVIALSPELNRCYLHQFILGDSNHQQVIDHINRNPLDNRKENLRLTNRSVNSTNASARVESKTGIRGVYKRKARPGISKEAWICEWSENSKRFSRSFSIEKYGEEEAFQRACSLREQKLREMKI